MSILKTSQLKKYYGSGDTLVKALDGVDLSVELGEFVAIARALAAKPAILLADVNCSAQKGGAQSVSS